MSDYLVHHGVLGMKWGIRRYQPYSTVPRGSGKRGKEIGDAKKHKSNRLSLKEYSKSKKYNYKSSDSYKKLSSDEKQNRDTTYTKNKKYFGEKTANRIEYRTDMKGMERSKAMKKAVNERKIKDATALVVSSAASKAIVDYVIPYALNTTTKTAAANFVNNQAVSRYAAENGLKTYNKGVASPQTVKKAVTNGRKIVENDLLKYF